MGMFSSSYNISVLMLIPRYQGHEALDVGHLTHRKIRLAPDRAGLNLTPSPACKK